MDWSNRVKNITDFAKRAINFLVYFWGTDEDKYVVDHSGRKIVFSLDYSFAGRTKNTADYTNRAKN